jgi:hypothetical protein
MPFDIDFAGDFSQVVDGIVAVVLKRRGGAVVAIDRAWRFATSIAEPEATGGRVATTDTIWQFEWPTTLPPPTLGDQLVDDSGECGTLILIERLGGNTRWRATARNLRIAWGLDQRVAIHEAEWDDSTPAGLTGWRVIDPLVAAHIQPQTSVADLDESPPTHTQTFRVHLDTQLTLDGNHSLVTAEGTRYRVREFENAARIDVLPVAVVERSL